MVGSQGLEDGDSGAGEGLQSRQDGNRVSGM